MISAHDFVHLPYTRDLTPAGIVVCRRSLDEFHGPRGRQLFSQLRRHVARVALQLAFQRYLGDQGIAFRPVGEKQFGNHTRYDLALGRRRCAIVPYLISRAADIAALRADVSLAPEAMALIPADAYLGSSYSQDDVYVFAAALAPTKASIDMPAWAAGVDTPEFLIHPMPKDLANPGYWRPLGPLALKSESHQPLELELAGQNEDRQFIAQSVRLEGGRRREIDGGFYSLTHLHAKLQPRGRIGVNTSARPAAYLVNPGAWGNIWIQGTDVLLLGWMSHSEFGRRARLVPKGSQVFQFSRTQTVNLGIPVSELRPLARLLEASRTDQGRRS